jgi:hypothetical protein
MVTIEQLMELRNQLEAEIELSDLEIVMHVKVRDDMNRSSSTAMRPYLIQSHNLQMEYAAVCRQLHIRQLRASSDGWADAPYGVTLESRYTP